ncbi:MAG: Holliday junction branch migration protein RuvA [Candidatus Cloacimonetes bacterium]|nr:Holliday junction branch migration protein RuvA [Candidatus Cloacimonadota bacterium]
MSEKTPDTVVIDCNGIGFELKIPLSTFDMLPAVFEVTKLFVYTFHNDEGTRLFGFLSKQEKELFKLLINVNRVGPKTALAILSSISIKDLITAILTGNSNIIAKTPGLGKKSAERLIIELKDKIEIISELDTKKIKTSVTESHNLGLNNDMFQEVESALVSLGYKNYEIRKALQNVKITNIMTIQEVVKECIKYIYLKRNEI